MKIKISLSTGTKSPVIVMNFKKNREAFVKYFVLFPNNQRQPRGISVLMLTSAYVADKLAKFWTCLLIVGPIRNSDYDWLNWLNCSLSKYEILPRKLSTIDINIIVSMLIICPNVVNACSFFSDLKMCITWQHMPCATEGGGAIERGVGLFHVIDFMLRYNRLLSECRDQVSRDFAK